MDSPGPSKQDHYRTTGQARKGEKDKKKSKKREHGWKTAHVFMVKLDRVKERVSLAFHFFLNNNLNHFRNSYLVFLLYIYIYI